MAHVKVVRRSMEKDEWIELRTGWIGKKVVKKAAKIDGWKIREARQIDQMQYEFYDKAFRDIKDGEMYFTPDGTCFLKVTFTIPKELEGEKVYLYFKTAAEMMVKVNKKWAGGLDPNRDRLFLGENLKFADKITIEMEGYNRSKPDDERNPKSSHLRGCRQVFNGGSLVTINDEVEAAYYDLSVLIETMQCEYIREDIREFIKNEIDKALNMVNYDEEDQEKYVQGIKALRSYLKDKIYRSNTFGKIGNVALVAHSHLDIAYYWRRIHTVQKNARTCLIQLKLMEKYPDYKYTHSQPYTFELLEKFYPEIFEEVKKKVKEGRFEPVGAMYVEPDCNIPAAESLIRQCLYGQKFYESRFGKKIDTCWLPDVFGNSWILPQILKKAGVKYFISNKMSTWNDTNKFPHNHFIWKGIDGTEIYACVPPTHFISWNSPEQIVENWESFLDKDASKETLSMFGYGDGGSGATSEMIEYMHRLEEVPGMPNIRHVSAEKFLEDNFDGNEKLKVWDGELYLEMHRGTFTTKAKIKKWNRKLEVLIRDTEMILLVASLKGYVFPKALFDECYKKLLVNQFHDILPGTHIQPVTRDALKDYEFIYENLIKMFNEALDYLKLNSKKANSKNISLLNTLGWNRQEPVFIEGDFKEDEKAEGLISQKGNSKFKEGLWIQEVSMPAVGTKKVKIVSEAKMPESQLWFNFEYNVLSTPLYDVHFSDDGSIASLIDKKNERDIVKKGSCINKIKIYHDNPGMYDAWDILNNYKDREVETHVKEKIHVKEYGKIFVMLEAEFSVKNSVWTQNIRFYKDNARIDFDNKVDWQERNILAKAEFNFNILARQVKCDTGAGTIVRDTHKNTTWQQARFETCHHKWADMSETGYGVSLLNDSKYGISFNESEMGLSLLRSPIRPDVESDKEVHIFSYALLPHTGLLEDAEIINKACEFNYPVYAFSSGEAEDLDFIEVENRNIFVQAVKNPENDNSEKSIIIRLTELKGQRGKGSVRVSDMIKEAYKLNLLEENIEENNFKFKNNKLYFDYKPFEIMTFKLKF